MKETLDGRPCRTDSLIAAVMACAFLALPCAHAADAEAILDDAKITGKAIYFFSDAGRQVTLVLGDFKLTAGDRVVFGRDAVIWVRASKVGQTVRHDLTVYVEGRAKVVEPGGQTTQDHVMLVTLRQAGRLTVAGAVSKRPLSDFPLYKRALAARRKASGRSSAGKQPVRHPAPPLVIVSRPAKAKEAAPVKRPVPAPRKPAATVKKTPAEASPAKPAAKPRAKRPVQPTVRTVTFRADRFVSQELSKTRRITIARGNVYLSQGSPDSDLFLELRSQSAVVFSEKGIAEKKTRFPLAPKARQASIPLASGQRETIVGVYLEGDVVLARGERYMRGPSCYYDFTTDRAIMVEAVFRTVQQHRNIPIYIRARQARTLSASEMWFKDAKVSTSDFYTPSYHFGSKQVHLEDRTPYDEREVRIGRQTWHAKMKHTTFNVRGLPIFYWPRTQEDFTREHTAIRRVQAGKHGRFGWGVETEWHLFRLLGLLKPEGVRGIFDMNYYEKRVMAGVDINYARRDLRGNDYTGYFLAYGVLDRARSDDFGDERENVPAPDTRGRILARHKHFLPNDWQLQFELSYVCDRNFLEEYFRNEFFAGKEQETLVYAKKQRDNWAFTTLLQYRINRFMTQTESLPDFGFHLLGEPLWADRLMFFQESHAGLKRWRPDDVLASGARRVAPWLDPTSEVFGRLDTRNELNWPIHAGPVNLVPFVVGRATYWCDTYDRRFSTIDPPRSISSNGQRCRPYGQIGIKANTHFWRLYNNVQSRLWNIHRLKHIITPEITAFMSDTGGVQALEIYPLEPGIETHLRRQNAATFAIYQRLQTKRGQPGKQHTVDWMRLNMVLGISDSGADPMGKVPGQIVPFHIPGANELFFMRPRLGRSFSSRPEYGTGRDYLNLEYTWNISDSTTLMTDGNYDFGRGELTRANIGLAVRRDPRLRYYLGMRYLRFGRVLVRDRFSPTGFRYDKPDSLINTVGFNYKISRKYSLSVFEQYDFDYDGGRNLATSITLTRKLPRWYVAFTFEYDATDDELTMLLTFWPEGIPEVRVGGGRLSLLGGSRKN
ncbi:MAG: LPS assembly protein LptD [Planctomycetota bacterium]|nr:LPS assembly protein LptD [Planctomycetota bacterium]